MQPPSTDASDGEVSAASGLGGVAGAQGADSRWGAAERRAIRPRCAAWMRVVGG